MSDQREPAADDFDPPPFGLNTPGFDSAALSLLPPPLASAARAAATNVAGNTAQPAFQSGIALHDFNDSSEFNFNSSELELFLSDTQYLQLPEDPPQYSSLPVNLSPTPVDDDASHPLSPLREPFLPNSSKPLTVDDGTVAISDDPNLALMSMPTSSPSPALEAPTGDSDILQAETPIHASPRLSQGVDCTASQAKKHTSLPQPVDSKSNSSRRVNSNTQRKRNRGARPAQNQKGLLKIAPRILSTSQEGTPSTVQQKSQPNSTPSNLDPVEPTKSAGLESSVVGNPLFPQDNLQREISVTSDAAVSSHPLSTAPPLAQHPTVVPHLPLNVVPSHSGIFPFLSYPIHPHLVQHPSLPISTMEQLPSSKALENPSSSFTAASTDENQMKHLEHSPLPLGKSSLTSIQFVPQVVQQESTSGFKTDHKQSVSTSNTHIGHLLPRNVPHIPSRLVYDPNLMSYIAVPSLPFPPLAPVHGIAIPSASIRTISQIPKPSTPVCPSSYSPQQLPVEFTKEVSDSDMKASSAIRTKEVHLTSNDNRDKSADILEEKTAFPGSTDSLAFETLPKFQTTVDTEAKSASPRISGNQIVVSVDGIEKKFHQQPPARLDRHPVLDRLQLMDVRKALTSATNKVDSVHESLSNVPSPGIGDVVGNGARQSKDLKPDDPKNIAQESKQGVATSIEIDEKKVGNISEDSRGVRHQKKRLVWTPELHDRFVKAIETVGLNQAVPKTLVTIMNVEGLTTEHVKSHLQKYRNSLRTEEEEGERKCLKKGTSSDGALNDTNIGGKESDNTNPSLPLKGSCLASNSPRSKDNTCYGNPDHLDRPTTPQSRKKMKKKGSNVISSSKQRSQSTVYNTDKETDITDGKSAMDIQVKPETLAPSHPGSVDVIDKNENHDGGHADSSPVVNNNNSPLSEANGCTQRELELELVKERTLKLQLQLQVMVHRTITLNRKFQQRRGRDAVEDHDESEQSNHNGQTDEGPGAENSAGQVKGSDLSASSPLGSEKRKADFADAVIDRHSLDDNRFREKRRKKDDSAVNDSDEATVQTELTAILSDQIEMSKSLEETRVLLDGHITGRHARASHGNPPKTKIATGSTLNAR